MLGPLTWNKKAHVACQANVVAHIAAKGAEIRVTPSVINTYAPKPRKSAETNAGNIEYMGLAAFQVNARALSGVVSGIESAPRCSLEKTTSRGLFRACSDDFCCRFARVMPVLGNAHIVTHGRATDSNRRPWKFGKPLKTPSLRRIGLGKTFCIQRYRAYSSTGHTR